MKSLSERERRLLTVWAVAVAAIVGWYFWTDDPGVSPAPISATTAQTIPAAERQLATLRRIRAGLPAREAVLEQVRKELQQREKGLILADTAPQAQAHLLGVVRRIASAQTPPIQLRSTDFGPVKDFGDAYGEIYLSLGFDAGIEQLVNFLSELTAATEAIGTTEVHIGTAHPKQKTVPVRIGVSALVKRDLVPQRKAGL